MKVLKSDRLVPIVALVGVLAALLMMVQPVPTSALPDYATKTGQACGVCHVNPAGGGALTARGTAFAAIPTHTTDPAGAFTQSGAAASPTAAAPAATPTAAAKPAATPPAATPTAAAPKPTATAAPGATATATPGALPRTGGLPLAPLAVGGGGLLLAMGWSIRRLFRR